MEFGATAGIRDNLDAKSDFSEGHHAHMEVFERLGRNEREDFTLRPGTAEFREDIGIEKPTGHKDILRTGIGVRFGAISISRSGDACSAAIKA